MTELPWSFWVFVVAPLFLLIVGLPLLGKWLKGKGLRG